MSGISTITKIRYNPRGTYASNVRYGVDDMVFYLGSYYRCVVEGTLGTAPVYYNIVNSPWEKLTTTPYYRGEFDSQASYLAGDVVGLTTTIPYDRVYSYQEEDMYICLASGGVIGYYPATNPDQWKLISKGNFNTKRAFLSTVNEGYVPGTTIHPTTYGITGISRATYKDLWDARCGARPGGVGIVSVTAGGSGYTTTRGYPAGLSTAIVTITNGTGGTGVGASAVAYVSAAGTIFALEITNPGYGYSSAPIITITGGGGNGATATAYSYQGKIGMGDTVGKFKTPGATGTGMAIRYVNKRYGLMNGGYQSATTNTFGWSSNSTSNSVYSESSFIHNEWYEGLLPTPDGEPPKIIQVEGSTGGTLVLFNNGEVHYAGYNAHGQSGDATTTVNTQFVRCGYANTNKSGNSVLRGKKAIRIASSTGGHDTEVGSNYALIENPGGSRELWAWGYNGYGQLADGTTTDRSTPVQINLSQATHGKIIEIWATGGQYGNLWVLTDTGRLFSAGYGINGNLGDGTLTNKSVLTRIGIGSTNFTWTGPLHTIKKFTTGQGGSIPSYHILTTNGTLWSWGYNASGSGTLGMGHAFNVTYPVQVNSGGYSGVSATRTYATGAGTTVGFAFTNVYDVWGAGQVWLSNQFISVGSTVNPGLTTALGTGYNNVYQLDVNNTTNQSTYVGLVTTKTVTGIGSFLKNVVDFSANQFNETYQYTWGAVRCININAGKTEHYTLPLSYDRFNGHGSTYNTPRLQDPDYADTSYAYKPIFSWPLPFDQTYIKVYATNGTTYNDGGLVMVNLKDGRMYASGVSPYGVFVENNLTASSNWSRLQNH